jgi:hypothetical protein
MLLNNLWDNSLQLFLLLNELHQQMENVRRNVSAKFLFSLPMLLSTDRPLFQQLFRFFTTSLTSLILACSLRRNQRSPFQFMRSTSSDSVCLGNRNMYSWNWRNLRNIRAVFLGEKAELIVRLRIKWVCWVGKKVWGSKVEHCSFKIL